MRFSRVTCYIDLTWTLHHTTLISHQTGVHRANVVPFRAMPRLLLLRSCHAMLCRVMSCPCRAHVALVPMPTQYCAMSCCATTGFYNDDVFLGPTSDQHFKLACEQKKGTPQKINIWKILLGNPFGRESGGTNCLTLLV